MKHRRTKKVLLIVVVALSALLLMLFILFNLPVGHRFITARVNSILKGAGVPVHITSITRILPKSLGVEGVTLSGPDGDTIIYAGEIGADFVPLALLKKRIIISSFYLNDASVNISRGKKDLNIAEAFSNKEADTVPKPENTKKKWEFSIGRAEMSDISFQMNDTVAGININQKIGNLNIEVSSMSLPQHIVLIRSIALDGSAGNIKISPDTEKKDTVAGVEWKLGLGKLSLSNINLGFNNTTGKQLFAIKLGEAEVDIRKIDLKNKIIDFGDISFLETGIILLSGKTDKPKEPENTVKKETFPWDINARDINLENISFKTGVYGDTITTFGISNLDMNLSDLKLSGIESSLKINKTKFDLNNGFSLKAMTGYIESGSKTEFRLSVETVNSTFNIETGADEDLFSIFSNPRDIKKAALSISETHLSLKDLMYFNPDLADTPVFKSLAGTTFSINARTTLIDSVLNLQKIVIESGGSLHIALDGKINNGLIKEKANGELKIEIPNIDVVWLTPILKAAGLKLEFPDIKTISLSASLSGSMKSIEFAAGISGDLGNTDINGTFDYDNDNFHVKSVFTDVLPGKIINNPIMGSYDGSIEINGSGLLHKNLSANIDLIVDSLGFKGYEYTGARLVCKILNQDYRVNLNINDPGLKCNLETSLNTADSILDIKAEGSFYAGLNKLNLMKDTIEISGSIKGDFKKDHSRIVSGLTITDLKLMTPGNYSTLEETKASFSSDSLKTTLNAEGDFFDINIEIEEPVDKLNQILPGYKRYAESYIDSLPQNRVKRVSYLTGMKADIKIIQHPSLSFILKDTTFHFSGFDFKAVNDPLAGKINYTLSGKNLIFKTNNIGALNIGISDSAGRMKFKVRAENCSLFSQKIDKILINSNFFNKQGITDFSLFEKPDKIMYDFEISSVLDSTGIIFTIPSKQMTLNSVKWNMDTPDLFWYKRSAKAMLVSLRMNTKDSYINVSSDYSAGLHTSLEMKQVDLASLLPVELISGKPSGTITGNAEYHQLTKQGKDINANLVFNNISWSDIRFRSLSINSSYKSETPKDFVMSLDAGMDSSKISFDASKPAEGETRLKAVFTDLSLKDFQPFVTKFLSELRGNISGNVEILLSDKIENFKGNLDIKGANVRINALNSVFKIPSDKVEFTGKKVVFDSFRVLDSLNNELQVDGSLEFGNTGTISDLSIVSKNLQIMGSTEKDNPTFFGNIFVNTHLSIKGPVTSPALKGDIMLAGGTEIFFKEKENLNLTETEKVMTFVTPVSLTGKEAVQKRTFNVKSSIDADVSIDPDTKINFELTKRLFNIDLMIKGGGDLSYSMQANKEVSLAGKYEISDGTADVKITGWPNKSFKITRGGSVRWDGKVDDPDLNFEAVNKVHTSYLNPVDSKQRNADVNVTLKLANKLSALDLLFTINTPDQYLMSIINTLSPEEQMRQAITILLFNKIDLPGISTSSDYMTEQVNELVASQLNQLTKTSISGIDISFGIDSYVQTSETGGQETKTSLSYEVKKALLNDRAQIEVSGRLNDDSKPSGSSELSLNNLSFEYRLDSAGTKFLKVYNEHTYEDVFEGEVIKTGVGVTYRKNYPTLRDIWRKKNKKVSKDK